MSCEYNRMQAALGVTSQLSDKEQKEFEEHCTSCPSCRVISAEMAQASRELFMAQARRAKPTQPPRGLEQRFLERAGLAGVPVRKMHFSVAGAQNHQAAFAACLLAVIVFWTWKETVPLGVNKSARGNLHASTEPEKLARAEIVSASHALPFSSQSSNSRATLRSSRSKALHPRHTFAFYQSPRSSSGYEGSSAPLYQADQSGGSPSSGLRIQNVRPFSGLYLPNLWNSNLAQPHEQFHYDVKLASLSLLDSPRRPATDTPATFRFSTPTPSLTPNRTW